MIIPRGRIGRILLVVLIITGFSTAGIALLRMSSALQPNKASLGSSAALDRASSLTVIVNKHRPLNPIKYIPAGLAAPRVPLRLSASDEEMQLAPAARAALETMFTAAEQQGLHLMLASGYRSYTSQVTLYNYYVQVQGKSVADSQSARPGYSEHQTGLAADIAPASGECSVQVCFATTPEAKWLSANAYSYGFVIRYPEGKQDITGYIYEPWHIRYIGVDVAKRVHDSGLATLEQFFKLDAAPSYQ